jgi:hypothetical protein
VARRGEHGNDEFADRLFIINDKDAACVPQSIGAGE